MAETSSLSIRDLRVTFPGKTGAQQVVRGLSLDVFPGKTLGLVGESGSGKSMTALAILGLLPFSAKAQGQIRFKGRELLGMTDAEYAQIRGSSIAVVFQDPSTSLNPVLTIGQQLIETILQHRKAGNPAQARQLAIEYLQKVEIPAPAGRIHDYPHQLSGGMKQRVLIAMALSCDPDCLILDEPTTALDVTVQAQLLDLIERIQHLNHMSVLLISHDLGVVSEISDEIAIIYAGRIVETAPTEVVLNHPRHPYTRGLLNSIPRVDADKGPLKTIQGFPPDPADIPSGCPFHPRCPRVQDVCRLEDPAITLEKYQAFACWNPEPQP